MQVAFQQDYSYFFQLSVGKKYPILPVKSKPVRKSDLSTNI